MSNQITINTSGRKFASFLQEGFYASGDPTRVLHKHNYAEIHVVANSPSLFNIGGRDYSTQDGNIIIIPGGVYHCCIQKGEDSIHSAFQVDCDIRTFSHYKLSNDTLTEFFQEIQKCKKTSDYSKVAA